MQSPRLPPVLPFQPARRALVQSETGAQSADRLFIGGPGNSCIGKPPRKATRYEGGGKGGSDRPGPAPLPFERAPGFRPELEFFRDAQAFHPPKFAGSRGCHHSAASFGARNFQIGEQVLEFHRFGHPAGLKTVAAPPMPQNNVSANLICIEPLAAVAVPGRQTAPRLNPRGPAKASEGVFLFA